MTLPPGTLGKTSVAHEHEMTSDHDIFSSCMLGHPLTTNHQRQVLFLLMEKNKN